MTTNEHTMKAITVRVGNGQVVHSGIAITDANGNRSLLARCGAEGRRYHQSVVREVTGQPVSCGRCSDQPAPVAKRQAAVVQTPDQRNAAVDANIARLQESIAKYRGWLAQHPGDQGLLDSIANAEASIARWEALR